MALILNLLHQEAPISRAVLSKRTGINKATISAVVRELIRNGIVIETGPRPTMGEVGHPSIQLMINPDAGRVIGAEIRGDCITAVVTDLSPTILWRHREDIRGVSKLNDILDCAHQVLNLACEQAKHSGLPILGLGLGVPGLADIKNNILLSAPELGWGEIDLNPLMEENGDIPFYIGNEAHFSALGDSYFGASRNSETSLYISLGDSINGGIVVNENVLPGGSGLAGEVGHMSLDPSGERCSCGAYGCWNTVANQRALLRRVRQAVAAGKNSCVVEMTGGNLSNLTFAQVLQAAHAGDDVVLDALRETGYWLGVGMANLINLINPEYLVLGGSLSAAYKFFQKAMEEEIVARALHWQRERCRVTLSRYGEDDCLIGAVATVFWNILNDTEGARHSLAMEGL